MTSECHLCPRSCGINRLDASGVCGASDVVEASAVCLHTGEEPPISGPRGIVNVFFSHCNLHCIYCQNAAISGRRVEETLIHYRSIEAIVEQICRLWPHGSGLLGLVSVAHYLPVIRPMLDLLAERGIHPTVVYNSSGYESVDSLRSLEGLVDIYLPDYKYRQSDLAQAYSGAADYPAVAEAALAEMRRQVGGRLKVAQGVAYRGLLVRHLVLPGAVDNSLACLQWLADAFPSGISLSLMAQYFPPTHALPVPLDRTITADEYAQVVAEAERLGFDDVWTQQLEAEQCYRPDFSKANPFQPISVSSPCVTD